MQSVIDQGDDPREIKAEKLATTKRAKQEAEIKQTTLRDIWPRYIAEASRHGRRKNSKPWGAHHIAAHERAVKDGGALSALLDVAIADLTEQRLKQWLEIETASRATVAALAYRMLRTCLNWIAEQPEYSDIVNTKAISATKVVQVLPKPTEKNNQLRERQIKPWFDAVLKLPNQIIAVYLQVVLLSGRRREEILDLKWTDLDFKWATMTVNDKVQGRVTLPLAPYSLELLNKLPRNNEWVFSSPSSANGRLQEPRKSLDRVIAEIGVPHTIHDLRRTYATLSEEVCPAGVAAQLQGHVPKDVRGKHYVNRSLDTLAKWAAEVENTILSFAERR
ncbi:tyrosine-type recombinase/integrase [Chitinibacter sp. SCUT-21]|uniref:tyrosine-type recombinase/integrase n=1 Tax=Chitinibacter sp. SCUT-21 TaxID=2970891 RepID=UPI0035A58CED